MADVIEAPSLEKLQDYEGSTFSVEGDASRDLELAAVESASIGSDGVERFALVFQGDEGLESGTHRLSAEGLDVFDIGLSPTIRLDPETTDNPDAAVVEYEAVFARHDPDEAERLSGESSDLKTDGGVAQLAVNAIMGSVGLFAGNFAPQSFMKCEGQTLQISQYSALYSLLGATFGGDGRTTFKLPDLRGRAPIGAGAGPGLTPKDRGQKGGQETVTLTEAEIAPHAHQANQDLPVSVNTGDATSPDGNALAAQSRGAENPIYTTGSAKGSMAVEGDTEQAGGGDAHDNMSPYLAMNYVICVQGTYPSRS